MKIGEFWELEERLRSGSLWLVMSNMARRG